MGSVKKKTNSKGFTLIEVVLVLAIGGLIFLLAFIAFRQASTNRRDSQRRSDVSRFVAEVNNYSSDANGLVPDAPGAISLSSFVSTYLGNSWKDPSNNNYTVAPGNPPTNPSTYRYLTSYKCTGNSLTAISPANTAYFAIVMRLEKGFVCRDNQ